MSTRTAFIGRIADVLGDDSTDTITWLNGALDDQLYVLWDKHDWQFKHKSGTFNTVSGTEEYDLTSSITDIRSAEDIEVMYDKTNGRWIEKIDLKDIRKAYPKEDTTGKPYVYAPWGSTSVFLSDEPDGIYTIKLLYLSVPTLPTADSDSLQTVCGLPRYLEPLLYQMVLKEGMEYYDDDRYTRKVREIEEIYLPAAIRADMKHLESTARFKFWEEEVQPSGTTYDDFLRRWWWGGRD